MPKNQYFAYRSFWPELKKTAEFAQAGVNTVCFFSANTVNSLGEPYCLYEPTWHGPGNYDFSPFDRQVADLLGANPKADFLCMVDLNSPPWMQRRLRFDSHTDIGHAIHLPDWLAWTRDYLAAFLQHAESRYPDRIRAYVLAAGGTCEWQDRTHGDESSAREAAFQKWCGRNGHPVPERIPAKRVRDGSAHFMLRDPQEDAVSIRYWQFCSESIVDTIKHFVGEARKIIRPAAEIGVFYGYIIELAQHRHISDGYVAYERLLDTPGLDFLVAPGTYQDRGMGGGSGFMLPIETVRRHGFSYLHECDQRTSTVNRKLSAHLSIPPSVAGFSDISWPGPAGAIAGIKREAALCLIERTSLWWFDMWGGFYEGEGVMDAMRRAKEIWDEHAGAETKSVSEVLLVIDPESAYYFNETEPLMNAFILETRNKLNRLGAPFSICSFNDLETLPHLRKARLVIFANAVLLDDAKRKILQATVLKDGKTVLWLFAPGILDGKTYQPDRVKDLCGTAYGTEEWNRVEKDGWKSVYVYNPADLTPQGLKKVAAEAGVHLYCEKEVPVHANSRFVAIHTAEGGPLDVKLPKQYAKVTELYRGETVAEKSSAFSVVAQAPDTLLFLLEE